MQKIDLLKYLKEKGYAEKTIAAFAAIDREKFVPEHLVNYAYEDMALPLSEGSCISQPSTIAFMLELLDLDKSHKILEIGAGSGFSLALTASIVTSGTIFGLEINPHLSIKAKERLSGFNNIHLINKSGFYGYPEKAPFDRILISASCEEKPYYLLDQLTESGIIVAAVRDTIIQIRKISGEIKEQVFYGFSFVPLKRE
jgi:protein-L-isoaspartate(D-aspartate) O-methyltransferase